MTLDLPATLRGARDLWRRDRGVVAPLSALFVFLPQYAVLLLVPPMPRTAAGATVEQWGRALEPWVAAYGGWYVLATMVAQYGALAVVSLYMAPVPTAGAAMTRAARYFPRALLAGLLVTFPLGVAALVSLPVPLLPLVVIPGIVYVLARTTLAGPVILAERGTGAAAAIVRSWRLTAGHGMPVATLVAAIMLGGQALGTMAVAAERGLRDGDVVARVLVDAVAGGVAWIAALALALVQVVLYRRLAG